MKPRPSMYSRPAKPLALPVPARDWTARTITAQGLPAPVVVDARSECHVTPSSVAERMADELGDVRGLDILEPSAGTGQLARAVLAAGCDPQRLTMVEMHCTLANGLRSIGPVENTDFLEWAAEVRTTRKFGGIIMNPPFSRVRAHVAAARSLLAQGGRLVALVPVTFNGDEFEHIETLAADTFGTAKVHTKIIALTLS